MFICSIGEIECDVHTKNTVGFNEPASSHNNGPTLPINAYEEIVDIPVYSKPLSTSNPMFLQSERTKHSSISSKKSISSQKSFENFQDNVPPHGLLDEKSDTNKSFENHESKPSDNEPHNQLLNEITSEHHSGKWIPRTTSHHTIHCYLSLCIKYHFVIIIHVTWEYAVALY